MLLCPSRACVYFPPYARTLRYPESKVKQKGVGTVSTSSTRAKLVLGKGGKEVPRKKTTPLKDIKTPGYPKGAKNFLGPVDPVLAVWCVVVDDADVGGT